jgi:hypothetical protein
MLRFFRTIRKKPRCRILISCFAIYEMKKYNAYTIMYNYIEYYENDVRNT